MFYSSFEIAVSISILVAKSTNFTWNMQTTPLSIENLRISSTNLKLNFQFVCLLEILRSLGMRTESTVPF